MLTPFTLPQNAEGFYIHNNLAGISQVYWECILPSLITPLLRGALSIFGGGHFVFKMLVLIF
jgi:hypothetical protein